MASQPGANRRQRALTIGESPYRSGSSFDLSVGSFHRVIGTYPLPVLRRKIHVSNGLFDPFLNLLGRCRQLHIAKLLDYALGFFQGCFFIFLVMNCLWCLVEFSPLTSGCICDYAPAILDGAPLLVRC